MGFPGGPVIKNPLPMQKMWLWSLGREDPLEQEMATHSSKWSCLRNPMDKGAWLQWDLQPLMGLQKPGHDCD